jgi:hypothetical protein
MAPAIPRSVISLTPDVGRLEPAPNSELSEDVDNVRLHGVLSNNQACRDFSIGQAFSHELQYIAFARRQASDIGHHCQRSRSRFW